MRDKRQFSLRFVVTSVLLMAAMVVGAQTPPTLKLPETVVPVDYDLRLTLDANAADYSGSVTIDVSIAAPVDVIWINATGLALSDVRASVEAPIASEEVAEVIPGNEDFVGLKFPRPIPVGRARLALRFKGVFSTTEVAGLFRQKEADDWYVLTQFEAMYARRAFPCFDEPGLRASWRITLTVPDGQRAFSNMPVDAERAPAPGWREVSFRATQPIASYLVAIAVGPWDVHDGGTAGLNATPLRYIAPKGRAGEAAYAAKATPAIVDKLEAYFGQPFPFPKLDSITIPNSGYFFGAMENIGLITYDQSLLLATPDAATTRFQQRYVATAAHEIAHQWFGNLVTPLWWNDIWLNESFASWLGDKITAEVRPEWQWEFRRIGSRQWAIASDRLVSARRVRQPIEVRSDVRSAFDGISYSKGAALLAMFEAWLGPAKFQAGVRRYMTKHAWGVATADDFFAALAAEDDAVLPAFRGFVDRAGVPELAISLDCTGTSPTLTLTQSRFAPKGSAIDPRQRWVFPACFQYGDATRGNAQCTLVREQTTTLQLDTQSCPRWIVGNRAGIGYFLPALTPDMYAKLPQAANVLGPMDWVSLLADTNTLARGAALPQPAALSLAAFAAKQRDPRVFREALNIAHDVPPAVTQGIDGKRYASWLRREFGHRARALGWQPKPGEDADTQRLREQLVPFIADRGADAGLARDARLRAARWPGDAHAVPAEVRGELLYTAARTATHEGPALFAHFTAAAAAARDSRERRDVVKALGAFRDPTLARQARELLLTGPLEPREALLILATQLENDETRASALAWTDRNYDTLIGRGARDDFDALPRWADSGCSPAEKALFVAAFAQRMQTIEGGPRSYGKSLERIDLCMAYRGAQQGALSAWLAAARGRR